MFENTKWIIRSRKSEKDVYWENIWNCSTESTIETQKQLTMPLDCFAIQPVDDLLCVVAILPRFLWNFYCILEQFRQYGICFSFYHCNCTRELFGILMCYRSFGHSKYCYLLCVTLSGFYIRHSFTIFTKIKINIYFLITTSLKSWMDNNWLCTYNNWLCKDNNWFCMDNNWLCTDNNWLCTDIGFAL